MDNNRVIIHVDLNSFFATAEQQANPYLRGKPVGIIKAGGRTCVIAASVEAKKYGIKTGTSMFDAKKLCPRIILIPADFDKYEDITYRFIDICKSYSPTCEVFSLDECFIDVTESEEFFTGGAFGIALDIKKRLADEVGDWMTCSVGVSHNRLLAKLASGKIKCDGLLYIDAKSALEFLDGCGLCDVLGIGRGLWRHLAKIGIDSFPKLRGLSLPYLKHEFGPFWSVHLYNLARGIDGSSVNSFVSLADAKSVGRTYTTHRNLYKQEEIERLMRNLCEEAAVKARKMEMAGRYIGISLRGGEEFFWGHRTLKSYIDDGKQLFDLCLSISQNQTLKYVRFCGIMLGMLTKNKYLTLPIMPQEAKRKDLISAVDLVNSLWGDYTVFPAQLLGTHIIRPEVNGYFGDRKYRLSYLQSS